MSRHRPRRTRAAEAATESLEAVAAERGVRLVLDVAPAPVRGDEPRLRQLGRDPRGQRDPPRPGGQPR